VVAELTGLLVANAFYAVTGGAVFVIAGFVDRRRSTWPRLWAAYLFGVAIVVVPASYLALIGLGVGWVAISLTMLVLVVLAWRRMSRQQPADVDAESRAPSHTLEWVVALPLLIVAAVVLAHAWGAFAVRPLVEWDAWATWATKARLLYEAPTTAPSILRESSYGAPSYPLAFPTLQALGFRAMGTFDGTLIGIQMLLLVFGLVGAVCALQRRVARAPIIALAALVIVTASQFLFQLITHYADVPLAIFVAAGVAAGGAWLASPRPDGWSLVCFVAFLGMAGLTKNEGLLFTAAAGVALLATAGTDRSRWRPAVIAVAALGALVLPWRLYTLAFNLDTADYDLANVARPGYLYNHADRLHAAVPELWRQIAATNHWGYVIPIVALALVSGALAGRWQISLYGAVWLALSFAGLLITYWVSILPVESNLSNTSYRTIVSLIAGGLALTPLLLFPPGRVRTDER
jgi:hypothetical protein